MLIKVDTLKIASPVCDSHSTQPLCHISYLSPFPLFTCESEARKKSQLSLCVTHVSPVLPESRLSIAWRKTIYVFAIRVDHFPVNSIIKPMKLSYRSYVTIKKMLQLKAKITQWVTQIVTFNLPPPKAERLKDLKLFTTHVRCKLSRMSLYEGSEQEKVVNDGKAHGENEHCIRPYYRCTIHNGRVPFPTLENGKHTVLTECGVCAARTNTVVHIRVTAIKKQEGRLSDNMRLRAVCS